MPSLVSRPWWFWPTQCLAGAAVVMAGLSALGAYRFGSVADTARYVRGERLLVSPTEFSAGSAEEGESRQAAVTLANWTGREVTVIGSVPSCVACVALETDLPVAIPPGGKVELTVRIRTAARKAQANGKGGEGEKAATTDLFLLTDYPAKQTIRLTVVDR